MLRTELSGKRSELLKEVVSQPWTCHRPKQSKFPAVAIQSEEAAEAARSLGVSLKPGSAEPATGDQF